MTKLKFHLYAIIKHNGGSTQYWKSLVTLINSSQEQANLFCSEIQNIISINSDDEILIGLDVLDYMVDECNSQLHIQVGSKEFLSFLILILKTKFSPDFQEKMLFLLKKWGLRFKNNTDIPNFYIAYDNMVKSGVIFPNKIKENIMNFRRDSHGYLASLTESDEGLNKDFINFQISNQINQTNTNNAQINKNNAGNLIYNYGDIYLDLNPVNHLFKYKKKVIDLHVLLDNIILANDMIDNFEHNSRTLSNLIDIIQPLKDLDKNLLESIINGTLEENMQLMMMCLGIHEDILQVINRFDTLKSQKKPEPFKSSFHTTYAELNLNNQSMEKTNPPLNDNKVDLGTNNSILNSNQSNFTRVYNDNFINISNKSTNSNQLQNNLKKANLIDFSKNTNNSIWNIKQIQSNPENDYTDRLIDFSISSIKNSNSMKPQSFNYNTSNNSHNSQPKTNNENNITNKEYKRKEHLIQYEELKFYKSKRGDKNMIIGKGAFGNVFLGEYNGTEVAIKEIILDNSNINKEEVLKEIDLMLIIRHTNNCLIYGYVDDEIDKIIYIVTEYYSDGNLFKVLSNQNLTIDFKRKKSWLLQIAKGMNYLHSRKYPIIHRDLKPENIFITNELTRAVIGDFGLSKPLYSRYLNQLSMCGTIFWMAPEVLENKSNYNTPSDVYSYGIIMYEVFTRNRPYPDIDNIIERVCKGERPDTNKIDSSIEYEYIVLMKRCWDHVPEKRPTFSEIVAKLSSLK